MTEHPLRRNLEAVRQRIADAARRAGRDPAGVTLVAVVKYVDLGAIHALAALGVADLAESRVQDAERRIPNIPAGPTWHMVGHLQTNKVNKALRLFSVIHSLDRWDLAEALSRRARNLRAFVQVNIAGDPDKHGLPPDEVLPFVDRLRAQAASIEPVGLMTMLPMSVEPRPHFAALRELAARAGLPGLSMGMSGDFEPAVGEGATHVRIGSALFEGVPMEDHAPARH